MKNYHELASPWEFQLIFPMETHLQSEVREALTKYAEVKTTFKRNKCIRNLGKIKGTEDAVALFRNFFDPETIELKESLYALYIDRANNPLAVVKCSEGCIHGTIFDVRMIVKTALDCNASGVILCHNHPSGVLEASEQDLRNTHLAAEALKLFSIKLFDHIILTADSFIGFSQYTEL